MAKILILHGPNLNLLGLREPQHYGKHNLATINDTLSDQAKQFGHEVKCYQSNAEHELIAQVHQALTEGVSFIVINPAAFTHTSIALRDALLATKIPFIEVHLSNIYNRESFRHHSYFSDIAFGLISGFGAQSYLLALEAIHHYLSAME